MTERFRVIDPRGVLFGLEGEARLNVLALVSARFWESTGLGAQRIYRAFEEDVQSGCGGGVNGALLAVARVSEARDVHWMAVRLRHPVAIADGDAVDLVFAIVGPDADPMLPQIMRCFDRVTRDLPALDGLRNARSRNPFCAELAWALERASRPSAIAVR
jgi:hypothetical protein